MDYISVQEAAEHWGISARRVQKLCADHRIIGVRRFGRNWMIPASAEKPMTLRDNHSQKTDLRQM